MTREQITPGATVEATQPLAYGIGGGFGKAAQIRHIEPNTRGTILRVEVAAGGWNLVESLFEGHDQSYQCDLKAAEFAFRAIHA